MPIRFWVSTTQTDYANQERAGVPRDLIGVVKDMYKECETRMEVGQARSCPYEMRRGIKQGCPLSPRYSISLSSHYYKGSIGQQEKMGII